MKIKTDKEEIHLGPVANTVAVILAIPAMLVIMCAVVVMIPLLLPTITIFTLFGKKVPITEENENNFSEEETE